MSTAREERVGAIVGAFVGAAVLIGGLGFLAYGNARQQVAIDEALQPELSDPVIEQQYEALKLLSNVLRESIEACGGDGDACDLSPSRLTRATPAEGDTQ